MKPIEARPEDESVEEVRVDDLDVHEHASCRRIDALIHARCRHLPSEVEEARHQELGPGRCATLKLEDLMIQLVEEEPDSTDDDSGYRQVEPDHTEVDSTDPPCGHR